MEALGENPFQSIGKMSKAQQKIEEEFNGAIAELSRKHGRENVVMALEGYCFDIRNRNILNSYDIPDELFEDLMHIKQEYDIEIRVEDITPEEFVSQICRGNPLMGSVHQWPSIETWEKQWGNLKELRNEYGDIVLEVFFDLVIFTGEGYHERQKYVDAIVKSIP